MVSRSTLFKAAVSVAGVLLLALFICSQPGAGGASINPLMYELVKDGDFKYGVNHTSFWMPFCNHSNEGYSPDIRFGNEYVQYQYLTVIQIPQCHSPQNCGLWESSCYQDVDLLDNLAKTGVNFSCDIKAFSAVCDAQYNPIPGPWAAALMRISFYGAAFNQKLGMYVCGNKTGSCPLPINYLLPNQMKINSNPVHLSLKLRDMAQAIKINPALVELVRIEFFCTTNGMINDPYGHDGATLQVDNVSLKSEPPKSDELPTPAVIIP